MKDKLRSKFLQQASLTEKDVKCFYKPHLSESLVEDITNFSAAFPLLSKTLFETAGTVDGIGHGIGRGEILIYFLFDEVSLGGTTSSIDIHECGIPYFEVKCARQRNNSWQDFRLGTDEWPSGNKFLAAIIHLLTRLDAQNKVHLPDNLGNIPASMISAIKKHAPIQYQRIEDTYFDSLMLSRMGSKTFLFFDTTIRVPIYFGKLARTQLTFERFSSGQPKLIFNPK